MNSVIATPENEGAASAKATVREWFARYSRKDAGRHLATAVRWRTLSNDDE
ncbi:hypothetical protein [Rhodocyclus tenuis]|uniref:Uncharacterized protein n=1 Tax=Rhodocyclus tenuis TaxID=1066 RepID=A0A840FZ10_RHOTE|nr:hypothetical protein [Rhodocyclus tenuis]MBB4247114.1 hypothetical protein [Rhodocyclus tenuis]